MSVVLGPPALTRSEDVSFAERGLPGLGTHYMLSFAQAPGPNTAAKTINSWDIWPIYFPGLAITKVGCEVTTPGAGNGRIAIWDSDASGLPGSLLLDSGSFSVNSTAIIEATVSFTMPERLVWIGINADIAATFRTGAVGTPLPFTSGTDFQGVRRGVNRAAVFGVPPNPCAATTSIFGGPLLSVRP